MLDVTPLSLGIETLGGVMTKLIERNTTIPTSKSQIFSTAADNQTQVDIHVLQGERELSADNKTLGRFILDGLPPAPRGVPQVEVTFDIDANGILHVSAKDKASGKEQKITITSSSGLSEEEVEKMKKDAEAHAEEDKKKRELIEAKNIAENLIYTAEKSLKDAGDKVDSNKKTEVEDKIKALKDVLAEDNVEVIKNNTESLSKVLQELGASMYQQANQEQTAKDDDKAEDAGTEEKKSEDSEEKEEEK